VIGVNSRIVPRAGGFVGLSFAIPIDIAMQVADALKKGKSVVRGRVGVTVQPLTADLARAFGLDRPRGALVIDVEENGPAWQAGLRTGDVVLAAQGRDIDTSLDLPRVISAQVPGSTATLDVLRDGRALQLAVAVAAARSEPRIAAHETDASGPEGKLGLALRPLSADDKRRHGISEGLAVQSVAQRSAAHDAEVKAGDVLLMVRGRPVRDLAGFREQLAAAPSAPLAVLLVRSGQRKFIALETDGLRGEQGPLAGNSATLR